jgi:hypothetical protein
MLVNEGLHHLLRAISIDPAARYPVSLEPVTTRVLHDLHDYLGQEFRGWNVPDLKYSLSSAGLAAFYLLARVQGLALNKTGMLSELRVGIAEELIAQLSASDEEQAAFYKVLSR